MDTFAIAAVLLGTLVVFGYLAVIWWMDRYEREPIWLTLLVFAWGGLGGTSLGCLCSLPFVLSAIVVGGQTAGSVVGAVLVAPAVEEVTKGVIFIALAFSRHLDNQTDGLIYGAAAGLGFAAVENILYVLQSAGAGTSALLMLVFMRTFFSAIVHCISSGILGMMIGYASHRSGAARWFVWPAIGLALAVVNHAIWNGLATAAQFEVIGDSSPLLMLLAILIVIAAAGGMFGLTQYSLTLEHKMIRQYLRAEAEQGVLPAEHAEIIPFWLRRVRRDWLPPHVPQVRYIRTATRLALRQHQLEIAHGERRERYLSDIAELRRDLARMLTKA
ncbi:MAG: PrsW family intramembrane metalloprotease [bacterium]